MSNTPSLLKVYIFAKYQTGFSIYPSFSKLDNERGRTLSNHWFQSSDKFLFRLHFEKIEAGNIRFIFAIVNTEHTYTAPPRSNGRKAGIIGVQLDIKCDKFGDIEEFASTFILKFNDFCAKDSKFLFKLENNNGENIYKNYWYPISATPSKEIYEYAESKIFQAFDEIISNFNWNLYEIIHVGNKENIPNTIINSNLTKPTINFIQQGKFDGYSHELTEKHYQNEENGLIERNNNDLHNKEKKASSNKREEAKIKDNAPIFKIPAIVYLSLFSNFIFLSLLIFLFFSGEVNFKNEERNQVTITKNDIDKLAEKINSIEAKISELNDKESQTQSILEDSIKTILDPLPKKSAPKKPLKPTVKVEPKK